MKPRQPDLREMKRHILTPLARGITGYLFWQYRPEILGQEAPAWGSVYLDGSPTPWYKDMAHLNKLVQNNKQELMHAKRRGDGIAILFSPQNHIANFAAHDHLDTYNDSLQGAHKLLHELNYKVEFLHETDVNEKTLEQYHCLWMPYPLYLNRKLCDILREWVEKGGILISECSFGALQAENGCHSYTVPGYGFIKVFGVRETWIHSAEPGSQLSSGCVRITDSDSVAECYGAQQGGGIGSRRYGARILLQIGYRAGKPCEGTG